MFLISELYVTGDGVGAAAKRMAYLAIKSGKTIQSAKQFVDIGNSDGNVKYILVRVADCYACRDLLKYLVSPRKVPGTLQIHNIVIAEEGRSIVTRRISCFNDCCWDSKHFKPVLPPRLPCKTHSEWTKPTTVELYTPAIIKKLEDKRLEMEEKERQDAVKRRLEGQKSKVS